MPRRSRHRRCAVALAALGGLFAAREARAQALLERFDPAERGSRFFVADSLELDGNLRFAAGVAMSYGHRLRTFAQDKASDPEASDLVTESFWIHPGMSVVVAPGARFAVDMPIALQAGDNVSLDHTFFPAAGSPRLGDLRVSFDLKLLGSTKPDRDGGVLAIGISAYLPTGSADDYTSDDNTRVDARLSAACHVGHWLFASRVGYMYRHQDLPAFGGVTFNGELNGVLALGYVVRSVVIGPELYGSTTFGDVFDRKHTPVEVLLGAHAPVGPLRVGAGVGTAVVTGLGAPEFRGVLSAEWITAPPADRDRDGDGFMDNVDLCPDVAGDDRGCPAPPHDSDGDGIYDDLDACPREPGVRTDNPRTNGCPPEAGMVPP